MKKRIKTTISIFLISYATLSFSSIQINNSRYYYIDGEENRKIELKNNSEKEYFVQGSVIQANNDNKNSPFILSPPIFKLGANETFFIDIIKIDNIEIENKESLFKINIKTTPIFDDNESNKNMLYISMNFIYDLFYRTSELNKKFDKAYLQLNFIKNKSGFLIVENPTAHYISVSEIKGKKIHFFDRTKTLPPFSKYNTKIKTELETKISYSVENRFNTIINAPSKEIINE